MGIILSAHFAVLVPVARVLFYNFGVVLERLQDSSLEHRPLYTTQVCGGSLVQPLVQLSVNVHPPLRLPVCAQRALVLVASDVRARRGSFAVGDGTTSNARLSITQTVKM